MFICEECHNEYGHLSGSYGRCEGCGKVADCYNCGCPDPWKHKVRAAMYDPENDPEGAKQADEYAKDSIVKSKSPVVSG